MVKFTGYSGIILIQKKDSTLRLFEKKKVGQLTQLDTKANYKNALCTFLYVCYISKHGLSKKIKVEKYK